MEKTYDFNEFIDIIALLRGEGGCPWDKEQTHTSLKTCMIEEAYEVVEGIDRYEATGDYNNLKEELGDVLLQVVMHSQIAKEKSHFSIDSVIDEVAKKMIRRHPHVFEHAKSDTTKEVLETWEKIKSQEKNDRKETDSLQSIPKAFPALIRADKILKKAEKLYLDKPSIKDTIHSIQDRLIVLEDSVEKQISKKDKEIEEQKEIKNVKEVKDENEIKNEKEMEYEMMIGSLLFDVIRLARFGKINAEKALVTTLESYINLQEVTHNIIKE